MGAHEKGKTMPDTYNGYTLSPISGEEFHAQFETRADEVITRAPSHPGNGTTLSLPYVNANGHYHLTIVVMPDGVDVRRSAVQYNGYGDDGHTADLTVSKKFGCAWSVVPVIDGLTPAPIPSTRPTESTEINRGEYRVIVTPAGHWYMLAQDGARGPVRVSRMTPILTSAGDVTLEYVEQWLTFADALTGAEHDSEKRARAARDIAEIESLLRPASQD